MELLNQELQLQSGEVDVSRGLLALNVAQDYFEALAASAKIKGGTSTGTVVTAATTETTTFPAGLLRIDRLQTLNSNSRPDGELVRINRTGGHIGATTWPSSTFANSTGKPTGYWENGVSVYWSPLPDGVYTIRWYGFQVASNITASGTFAYDDIVALPLAGLAVKLMKIGIDDPSEDITSVASLAFASTLEILSGRNRDGAVGYEYTQVHTE